MIHDIEQLIHDVLHGQATEADALRLSAWIAASKDNARAYYRVLSDECAIHRYLEQDATRAVSQLSDESDDSKAGFVLAELALAEANAEATLVELVHIKDRSWIVGSLKKYAWAALIAIATLTAVIVTLLVGPNDAPRFSPIVDGGLETVPTLPDVSQAVATLTAQHNAQWAEGASAPGSSLHPGQRLTLTAGFAEITTHDGAVAILQAPATIELIDHDNALRLHAGKLVGICETESSKGFVVRTPHMDITDLGTEFGVQVAGDYVDVSVFVGEVELTTHDGEVHPLTTNQTAKLKVNGNNRDVAIQDRAAEGFSRRLPRPALLTAWINDDRFKVEVAHQAVREDVRLFSDRVHELNGIDASGLPTVLLGGDIIRTPADARSTFNNNTEGLRIDAEFFAPADLYVLYSTDGHKRNYPDWLTRDYTLTTMRVGLDAGPFHDQTDEQTFVGPGIGIDEQLLVWKRKQPAMGRLEVSGHMTDAVYTIIAVPIEQGDPNPSMQTTQ